MPSWKVLKIYKLSIILFKSQQKHNSERTRPIVAVIICWRWANVVEEEAKLSPLNSAQFFKEVVQRTYFSTAFEDALKHGEMTNVPKLQYMLTYFKDSVVNYVDTYDLHEKLWRDQVALKIQFQHKHLCTFYEVNRMSSRKILEK